jgi:hypothetical protein
MKALSVRQPWAWLIVQGHKDIENRGWYTNTRGRVLVHASQTYPRSYHDEFVAFIGREIAVPTYEAMLRGGIVGEVEIVDCVRDHPSRWKDADSWGFVLRNAKPLPFVPLRGALGFFDVTDGVAPS